MSAGKINYPLARFDEIRKRYPQGETDSLAIPFLKEIQKIRGYIADEDLDFLSEHLEIPKMQLNEVLEFYTMFKRQPDGRHHIQVCRNLSCSLMGAEHIIEHLSNQLQIKPGETTRDGKFTLSLVECLASCGTAPVMQINESYHENLTQEKVEKILGELK